MWCVAVVGPSECPIRHKAIYLEAPGELGELFVCPLPTGAYGWQGPRRDVRSCWRVCRVAGARPAMRLAITGDMQRGEGASIAADS